MSLQWPSLQHRSTDYLTGLALFLLLKLNCAYKQVRSDLLNHSERRQPDVPPLNSDVSDGDPAFWGWTHMSNDAGAPSHSCTYRLVETCVPSQYAQQIPGWYRVKAIDLQSSVWEWSFLPQESKRHIVRHLLGCILTPHWRNRNATSGTLTRHFFPLGVFIPQLYHLHWRKFLLPVSKYCCIFAANLYKFASVTLHSFLQNMSLTSVLQLAICFYYLIPTVICLNKTVE